MEKASWRRHHGRGIMEKASWRRHHGRGIWEASGAKVVISLKFSKIFRWDPLFRLHFGASTFTLIGNLQQLSAISDRARRRDTPHPPSREPARNPTVKALFG